MTELKNKWIRTLMFLLVTTAVFTSCNKDENTVQNADYVGKWSSDVITSDTQGDSKHNLTLTKNTFEDIIQTKVSSGAWVNSFIVKGTMTVTNNVMNVHVSEIGVSEINDQTKEFTGNITTYKEGSLLYGLILDQTGKKADFQSEYTVISNKLTLKSDLNKDGDFLDANETTTYNRQ
ncbi:MAG: hypothetical protein ACM3O8_02645 [Methylococcaceae bacterium]|nr:hypothetical protein [Prolixibacteraceae bacterium]